MNIRTLLLAVRPSALLYYASVLFFSLPLSAQQTTWAEQLGYPAGAKVVIFHVDDVGMSWESNQGAIGSMTQGVANSCSIMMPCPWVPGYFRFLKEHPETDAGLHLTLTSEWRDYRWGPLAGKDAVPGLVDQEGMLWRSVADVAKHATPDEVEKEVRAQIERSLKMGFRPTHMDSHMGSIFATPAFIQRYVKLAMEYKIPVMFPGGHNTLAAAELKATAADLNMAKMVGQTLWNAGLPVIDDLHNTSYGFKLPQGVKATEKNIRKYKTDFYIKALQEIKPGITYVIMHCNALSAHFDNISSSRAVRESDYLAMTDPRLREYIQQEGIILTTMREMMERRNKLAKK